MIFKYKRNNFLQIEERFLDDKEVITDTIAENEYHVIALQSKNRKIEYSYRITLKMRIFIKLKENDVDTLSINFCQHLEDVLQGRFPLTQADLIKLAALTLHIKNPDFSEVKENQF